MRSSAFAPSADRTPKGNVSFSRIRTGFPVATAASRSSRASASCSPRLDLALSRSRICRRFTYVRCLWQNSPSLFSTSLAECSMHQSIKQATRECQMSLLCLGILCSLYLENSTVHAPVDSSYTFTSKAPLLGYLNFEGCHAEKLRAAGGAGVSAGAAALRRESRTGERDRAGGLCGLPPVQGQGRGSGRPFTNLRFTMTL
mmetsp:Transcript_46782/g.123655  ORF Transcript_46782/g.123655 Transcript_46782/m.123655 type:complete len:201 (+) Transcript_46782:640-1242(+)